MLWLENIPSNQKDNALETLAMIYPTWFFEVLCEFDGRPLRLEDFQIKYLLDDSMFKITNKCRQAGGSLQVSMSKMFKAMTRFGYRCDIVSINLKEATDKVKYVRMLWETLPIKYRLPLTIDNALSIGFHDGKVKQSVIHSLAASTGVRGGRKEMVFDEFAHYQKDEELYFAAAPAIMNGDLGLDIISTPMGSRNLFGKIWRNEPYSGTNRRPFDMFSRHEFIWLDVRRFVTDYDAVQKEWIDSGKNMAIMRELVEKYGTDKLIMFYEQFPWETFKTEFCGSLEDLTTAVFPWDLVLKCIKPTSTTVSDGKSVYHEEGLEEWEFEAPFDADGKILMGIDFGESEEDTDKTSVQIVQKTEDGRFLHRYGETYDNGVAGGFPEQAERIALLIRKYRPDKIMADETGMGRGLIPLLRVTSDDAPIEGVNFNLQTKEQMVMNMKKLMEQDKMWLLENYTELHGQINSIERKTTEANNSRYSGEPHDDMFWALALAVRAGSVTPFAMYTIGGVRTLPGVFV